MSTSDNAISPVQPVAGLRAVQPAGDSSWGAPGLSSTVVSRGTTGTERAPDPAGSSQVSQVGETFKARLQIEEARLSFEKDEYSGEMVVRVRDSRSGEVIRQIPPAEMLRIARAMEKYLGLLVDGHR